MKLGLNREVKMLYRNLSTKIIAGLMAGAALGALAAIVAMADESAPELKYPPAPFQHAQRGAPDLYKYRVTDLASGRVWVTWTKSRRECLLAVDRVTRRWVEERRNDMVAACFDAAGKIVSGVFFDESKGEVAIIEDDVPVSNFTVHATRTWKERS